MSEAMELADLYSAIEKSARVLGVPYAHDKVRAVLTAYEDAVPHSPIGFRMGTGQRYSKDVDWRFSVPAGGPSPYATAVEKGLIEETDHPISRLFSEVAERCRIAFFGVDFGAATGLKKLYLTFPPEDMEPLSALLDLPSIPTSVAENHGLFARHGMGGRQMPMFSIDYRHRTVNLYFTQLSPETRAPENIRSIHAAMGHPEPSERLLALAEDAFSFYATLSWDSPRVERTAFSVMAKEPADLPVPMEPGIATFLADMRSKSADDRFLYYVAQSAGGDEVYKVQSYYRFEPWLSPVLQVDGEDGQAG